MNTGRENNKKRRRIEREKEVVEMMIRFYCRKKEKNKTLCPACEELLTYACHRLDRCPFGEDKRACKQCPIHCYHPEKRKKMRAVMRYAGPRMIIHAPLTFIRHYIH